MRATMAVLVLVMAGAMTGFEFDCDKEMTIDQVPEAVRTTIMEQAGDGEILEIERETENGQVVYEAELLVDGNEIEIMVSESGEYLGTEDDD